jgi:hypothetical protein
MTELKKVFTTEWFISKGETKFGPFNYFDVIKMLQEKVVFSFDFAWSAGQENWVRLAEIPTFSQEFVSEVIKEKEVQKMDLFLKRKHKRIETEFECYAHNNTAAWKGQGVEMSTGGAGVVMNNSLIVPGDNIYLHVKRQDGLPSFNALCEIVAKQFSSKVTRSDMPIKYGLKFVTINDQAQDNLKAFVTKSAAGSK